MLDFVSRGFIISLLLLFSFNSFSSENRPSKRARRSDKGRMSNQKANQGSKAFDPGFVTPVTPEGRFFTSILQGEGDICSVDALYKDKIIEDLRTEAGILREKNTSLTNRILELEAENTRLRNLESPTLQVEGGLAFTGNPDFNPFGGDDSKNVGDLDLDEIFHFLDSDGTTSEEGGK